MTVFVLWGDRAVGSLAGFGPHVFLVACVASRLEVDHHRLRRSEVVGGRPCAGNSNVLGELQRPPLWGARQVIAVLDTDKIHALLQTIPPRSTIADADYGR